MVELLLIDTAVTSASVVISRDENIIAMKTNESQKDHAAWIHFAIKEVLQEAGSSLDSISAIAISKGPGSYTGLRVGMSAAKGICYAKRKPLIAINTLVMMAMAAGDCEAELLCPMIDARRMEVFTAVFDREMHPILAPTNLILEEKSFMDLLEKQTICFFGNGSNKFLERFPHPNALHKTVNYSAAAMLPLAIQKYFKDDFEDLAYSEPWYGKDFYLPSVKTPI